MRQPVSPTRRSHGQIVTPIIEPSSLDEAYLDVTENLHHIPLARDVAVAIRAKIKWCPLTKGVRLEWFEGRMVGLDYSTPAWEVADGPTSA